MTFTTARSRDLGRGVAIACVLALFVALALWYLLSGAGGRRITTYFGSTVGLYAGNEVRVLGVAVGTVEEVEPQGDQVRVELLVDEDVPIPVDASAVVVAPSLVTPSVVSWKLSKVPGVSRAAGP